MGVDGWAIPPRDEVFPDLRGKIVGFGRPSKRFEADHEHHIRDADALGGRGRSYDPTIYGIVRFFALALENDPNVVDSLFTTTGCVLHSTRVGNLVRETRRRDSHKGAWPTMRARSRSGCPAQLSNGTQPRPIGLRSGHSTQAPRPSRLRTAR